MSHDDMCSECGSVMDCNQLSKSVNEFIGPLDNYFFKYIKMISVLFLA